MLLLCKALWWYLCPKCTVGTQQTSTQSQHPSIMVKSQRNTNMTQRGNLTQPYRSKYASQKRSEEQHGNVFFIQYVLITALGPGITLSWPEADNQWRWCSAGRQKWWHHPSCGVTRTLWEPTARSCPWRPESWLPEGGTHSQDTSQRHTQEGVFPTKMEGFHTPDQVRNLYLVLDWMNSSRKPQLLSFITATVSQFIFSFQQLSMKEKKGQLKLFINYPIRQQMNLI